LFLLELAFLADDSLRMLAGMDLRTLKANLAKIEECAKLIDRLNLTELVYSSVFGPGSLTLRKSTNRRLFPNGFEACSP